MLYYWLDIVVVFLATLKTALGGLFLFRGLRWLYCCALIVLTPKMENALVVFLDVFPKTQMASLSMMALKQ